MLAAILRLLGLGARTMLSVCHHPSSIISPGTVRLTRNCAMKARSPSPRLLAEDQQCGTHRGIGNWAKITHPAWTYQQSGRFGPRPCGRIATTPVPHAIFAVQLLRGSPLPLPRWWIICGAVQHRLRPPNVTFLACRTDCGCVAWRSAPSVSNLGEKTDT